MRACAYAVTVLVLVAALGSVGCETVNNYACDGVSDGGCAMGYRDDEDAGDIFAEGAIASGNSPLTLNAGAVSLIDVGMADHQPHILTLALATVGGQMVQGTSNPEAEIIGHLSLGIGGVNFPVDIDYMNGQMITVAAARVSLAAEFKQIAPLIGVATPPKPNAAAAIAPGAIVTGRSPQRTLGTNVPILPGAEVSYVVPAFAQSVVVDVRPETSQLQLFLVSLATYTDTYHTIVAFPGQEIPIPNGVASVAILNTGVASILRHRLIFKLAL